MSDPALLALANRAAATTVPPTPPIWQTSELWLSLWLASAALFLAWRMISYSRMRRQLLTGARPVGEVGRIRLVETSGVSSPVAFGVWDKVVALPIGFMAMEDRAARDLAIAHELAHHLGRDILANFAAQPLLALHWFNPLAWIGWRALRRDQEAACDARVLAGRDRQERAAYANLIVGFAAGPRLALAAPMACPIIGEKSIIHRLRSLSMTDVSPSRRRLGRWLLAGAALALPLTASFSYAAAAQDSGVEGAPVAPAAAPATPVPPDAPLPPEAADGSQRHIERVVVRQGPDGNAGDKRVERKFVMRTDGPISKELQKRFKEMGKEWAKKGAEWQAKAGEWQKMAGQQRQLELAHVPEVSTDCAKTGGDGTRSWTDNRGRRHVVICERIIRDREDMAQARAMVSLRMAHGTVAGNEAMSASVKQAVLADLDKEIARLEAQK